MRGSVLGLTWMVATAAQAAGTYQPPDVKLGLWESSETTTVHGRMSMPEGLLARLTPEQRAKLEARSNAGSSGRTTTKTWRSCLTRQDLDAGDLYERKDLDCKRKILNSTGKQLDAQWDCTSTDGWRLQGTAHLDVLTPASVRWTIHGTVAADGGGEPMVSDSKVAARWIGSSCGDAR